MARPAFPKLQSSSFKGWAFVIVAGIGLAVVALIDRGGLDELRVSADGSTGCQLEVTAEELNIRVGPTQDAELLDQLVRGDRVDGTRLVTDGFRELEDGRWAADQFLTPVPGSDCG